jgi:hypothetical protein
MAGEEVNNVCDRRSGIERRQFTYTFHIPERRVTKQSRFLKDPRSVRDQRLIDSRVYHERACSRDRSV